MTLRHLKVFKKIAELNSITKTANELYIAQPAVSQTLAELERHYDTKLFERLNKKLVITASGKKLLAYANHMIALEEEIESDLGLSKTKERLKIGATLTIGTCLLPAMVEQFCKKTKKKVDVEVENTKNIEEKILSAQIDLGIVEGNIENSSIVAIPIMLDEIVFFKGKKMSETFAVREEGSGTREYVLQNLKSCQIDVSNIVTISSTEAIKNFVKTGYCISAMSKFLIEKELKANIFQVIDGVPTIKRNFFLCYHKDKFQNESFKKFVEFVMQFEI